MHRAPPTHVAGADLVRTHFKHYFGKRFEKEIPIVAAYPENYQHEAAWRELGLNGPMPQQKPGAGLGTARHDFGVQGLRKPGENPICKHASK